MAESESTKLAASPACCSQSALSLASRSLRQFTTPRRPSSEPSSASTSCSRSKSCSSGRRSRCCASAAIRRTARSRHVPHHSDLRHAQPLRRSARPRGQRLGGIYAHPRHRSRQRRRHRLLDGLECGEVDSRSRELCRSDQHERADRTARIDRPSRTRADDHRARDHGPRTAAHSR